MHDTSCVATDDGRSCPRSATLSRPVPLCPTHQIEIAMTVLPELLRDRYLASLSGPSIPPVRTELVEAARPTPTEGLLDGVHDHVVYFIGNGGRVKIGFTTNLKGRLAALSLREENVLVALEGGPELERALHSHFAAHRHGNTEWFELGPEVFRYIAGRSRRTARRGSVASVSGEALEARARQVYTPGMSLNEFRAAMGVGMAKAHPLHQALRAAEAEE